MKCDSKVCWCQNGIRPQDMPDPSIGDPGRFHMQLKTQEPPPLEVPIFFIGLFALLLIWYFA
jgi:hypothetical protein